MNKVVGQTMTADDAPLPVLSGSGVREPAVVREARIMAVIGIVFWGAATLVSLLVVGVLFSSSIGGLELVLLLGAIWLLMLFALLLLANISILLRLRAKDERAWAAQRFLSVLGLLLFPVGTAMHWLILSRWSRPDVKEWFGMQSGERVGE